VEGGAIILSVDKIASQGREIFVVTTTKIFLTTSGTKTALLVSGREQRSHIFSVEKIDELVPRQNFLTKKF